MSYKRFPTATPAGHHPTNSAGSAYAVLVFASVFYIANRLWRLTASCLWFDEIFSVHAARHSWASLLGFVAEDIVHPPLFYVLLKFWIAVGGESLLWLRLLPVLFAVLALVPFILLCRSLHVSPAAVNLAVLLMAVSSYFIKYAQTLRMYSLVLLLGLTSCWLFDRFLKNRGRCFSWALLVVNLLLIYTHYFGWAVVAAELIVFVILAQSKIKVFMWHIAFLAVCFSPWAWTVAGAISRQRGLGQNIGWAPRPGSGELMNFYFGLHEIHSFRWNLIVALLLFIIPLAFLTWLVLRGRSQTVGVETRRAALLLAVMAFAPTLGAFVLSYILPQSVWGGRHLIFAAANYVLLIAIGLDTLRPVVWRTAQIVAVGCWMFAAGAAILVSRPESFIWCAWEPLTARAVQDEEQMPGAAAVPIYAFEDLVAYHIWFALDTIQERRFRVVRVKGISDLVEDPAYFLPRLFDGVEIEENLAAFKGARIWLAFRDSSWDEQRPPLSIIRERGYAIERKLEIQTPQGTAFMIAARRRDTEARKEKS